MIVQDEQHPIDKQIGERIRKRRLMCGFSQRDLGKKYPFRGMVRIKKN